MQAGDVTLGQVFANDQQNVIPLFQRPYVWDQERNWEPLWLDIRQATEEVEAESEAQQINHERRTYFLGAVVIQQRFKRPQRIASCNVVDGQQRLTTLQILLAAARTVAFEIGETATSARFGSLIENRSEVVHQDYPDDRYKVWPLPADRKVFLWAVHHPEARSESPDPNHRLTRARKWFEETIREWVRESEKPEIRLEYLHDTLKDRMELVQITLGPHDDPQVIFEVLNHRGVPLDAADLIKNLLFQVLDEQGKHAEAELLLENEWLPLDHAPWREEITTGRVRRKRIDLLLAYWLSIMTSSEASVDHLFADFKKWLISSERDAAEVMTSIRHYADTMESLRWLPESSATSQLLERMDWLQHTTPWPIILYLHANTSVPESQRDLAARALESFLVRRTICRLTTKDYNRLFLAVLVQVKAAPLETAGDVLEQALLDQTAESRYWPPDSQFAAALRSPALYSILSAKHIKMLLTGLENQQHTAKTEPVPRLRTDDKQLNIEHLLPQSWEKNWPLGVDPDFPEYPARKLKRDQAVHQLGNLTLTTIRLNPALSNRAWIEKAREIRKHSVLRITTGSVLSVPDGVPGWSEETWSSNWTEEQIALRTDYLVDAALQLWNRPSDRETLPVANGELDDARPIDQSSTVALDWTASPRIESPNSITSPEQLAQYLISLIADAPTVKPDFHEGSIYIRFLAPEFDVPELRQSSGWTPSRRILLFEFRNWERSLDLKLWVGPGDQRLREMLIDGARESFVGIGQPRQRWVKAARFSSLYTRQIAALNWSEPQDGYTLKATIREHWEQFQLLELPAIVNAMTEPIARSRAIFGSTEQAKPPSFFAIRELASELVMSSGRFFPDFSHWQYIRFVPKTWDRSELRRSSGWTPSNHIMMFELSVTDDLFQIVLTVGPGPAHVREELVDHAHGNIPPFQRHDTHRHRRTGFQFTRLYEREFARPNEFNSSEIEVLKEAIRREWQRFLDEDYVALVDGMNPAIERLTAIGQDQAESPLVS